MQRILRRRILRDLRANLLRYLALAFMIVLGMYLVISIVAAADTLILGTARSAEEHMLEDGQFTLFLPLTEDEEREIARRGATLERIFSQDMELEDGSVLRAFRVRKTLDLIAPEAGRLPETEGEVLLEKRYCEENGLTPGDRITIGGLDFTVSGVGTTPDYDAPFKSLSDSAVDSRGFGTAFFTDGGYDRLLDSGSGLRAEEYVYAYRLNGAMTERELREHLTGLTVDPDKVEDPWFQEYRDQLLRKAVGSDSRLRTDAAKLFMPELADAEVSVLTVFLPARDNMRIGGAADDQVINRLAGLVAGVIVLMLFAYVISVFVIHGIEEESSVIGTLYALGVRREELLRHYLLLPVLVTFLAGAAGTALGFSRWGVPLQTADCYAYFSVPALDTLYRPYLIVYGVLAPPVIAALVNWIVIRRRLNVPALRLIRGEQKQAAVRQPDLKGLGFISRFRIRQMLRQSRSGLTIWLGMLVTLSLVMIGVDCYAMCNHIRVDNTADTRYRYMYLYKYPEAEVPEGGTEAYALTLKKEIYGYNLDVTVLGLPPEEPYFGAEPEPGMSRVKISTAMAQKYGISPGEKIILTDEESERDYAFTVTGLVKYSPGLYVFMDIDSMRELFGAAEDYWNVVFSDDALDVPGGRLYSVTTLEQIEHASSVFVELMGPMVWTMLGASALIFAIVMYLMMKVMIDRSAYGISLMTVFGYRRREIRKLYLDGNFYLVALGAAVCLPLAKLFIDSLYPMLISNVACGMDLTLPKSWYAVIYGAILALYLMTNRMLTGCIGRIVPAQVLKNRE